MAVMELDFDLMQEVVDRRFGGNIESATMALEQMQAELDYMDGRMTCFRKVGNQCLVFFTNQRAMTVCQENTDAIKGVIVNEYDTVIKPGAVIVGSFLDNAFVDRYSEVRHSDLSYSSIKRTQVNNSRISTCFGPWTIYDSKIQDSLISTSGIIRASIANSAIYSGRVMDEAIEGMDIYFDKRTLDEHAASDRLQRTRRRDLARQ